MSAIHPESLDARSLVGDVRFSICTLVTRPAQYDDMLASFRRNGFIEPECEYLHVDNSASNQMDGYEGVNLFLSMARGEFVIICHQDVVLLTDDRQTLETLLANLTLRDPHWAVCGNSGGISPGRQAIRITDPHGADQRTVVFPARVCSLDENFLLVRRAANLAVSRDLGGFHLYATDLCMVADVLGWTCYVVDFHLKHLSPGVRDASLIATRNRMVEKYSRAFRSRWIMTPCELMFVAGSRFFSSLLSSPLVSRARFKLGRAFAR